MLSVALRHGRRVFRTRGWRDYVLAAALVLLAAGVRAMLTAVWGEHHAYTAFYPAVLLAAYVSGRRAGLVATALAGSLGYWAFLPPALGFKLSLDSLGYVLFFMTNCTVAVLLIAGLNETLQRISREHREAQDAAERHADLFREVNDRVSHHLHLVATLLALQSDDEASLEVSDALARASEVSLSLSSLHREWAGASAEPIDMLAFAAALLRAKLTSLRQPADRIVLEGTPFQASPAEATSLGVVLLECATALGPEPGGRMHIALQSEGGETTVIVRPPAGRGDLASLSEAPMLRAVVRHASGRISIQEGGGALRIAMGAAGAPPPSRLH